MNSVVTEIDATDDFSISPEVFSPDGDGFEDITILQYELDDPDFIGSITIYDVKGRPVKSLSRNTSLGATGFFKWDGTDDNGESVRSGLYIVYVDLFDSAGNKKKFKLEVALTSR